MTNTTPVDAYRGAGRPEASYLLERLIDIASHELNIDPIEIRRKNFIQPDEFPYQTPVALIYDSGDYDGVFDEAVKISNYDKMRADQATARAEGRLVGVGVSGCIEASGAGSISGCCGLRCRHWPVRKRRDSRSPHWQNHGVNRCPQPRAGS